MVKIRFADQKTEAEALGFLSGKFRFRTFDDGTTIVPQSALGQLAAEGIHFSVEGKAEYYDFAPFRNRTSQELQ